MASFRQHEQQSFSFPLLVDEEILMCMEELQVSLSAKDLEKPNAGTVRAVYESLCEVCIGVTREELNSPNDDAMGRIEFPELHEESIPQLTYLRYVQKLLGAAGVRDVTLLDLTKPDPRRFRRNLSAVINFAKFREERLMECEELTGKTDALLERKAEVARECDEVESKIAKIREKREAEQPRVDELKNSCRELEAELKQSHKQHASLQHETKQLKAKSNELKDHVATLRFQKLNVTQETERMEGNIVRSPERLKTELSDLRERLAAEREENARLGDGLEELRAKDKALARVEEEMTRLHDVLKDLEGSMKGCKQALKETKNMNTSIRDHDQVLRQLQSQREETEKQIEITKDRVSRLANTKSLKVAAASHALSESKKEREQVGASNKKLQSKTSEAKKEIANVENELATQHAAYEAEVEKRRHAFKQLENLVDQSWGPLTKAMAANKLTADDRAPPTSL
ncbi:Kinetochore protein nuf2 [Hondaea fermentalgiana]|uniref:Kinetochore protein nuf2 n=1 Tax=Hondaea fermentalgiana TaxID=2315210 RepID=A0A2R5G649_9STRA|nr:Kinetochore protein nuf2 [Hondaea fermentalgiana]|eukprot:GBG26516.1 Kinetochore protein nuf2 [Hondaea fermentalgiana]